MSNDSQQNKNALIAVVLSGLVLFGWNYFFPQPTVVPSKKVEVKTVDQVNSANKVNTVSKKTSSSVAEVSSFKLQNGDLSAQLDSHLNLISFMGRSNQRSIDDLFKTDRFKFFINSQTKKYISFAVDKINDSTYKLHSAEFNISGQVSLLDSGLIDISLNSSDPFSLGHEVISVSENVDNQRFKNFVYLNESLETVQVGDDLDPIDSSVEWYGLDFEYHLFAYILPKKSMYRVSVSAQEIPNSEESRGVLSLIPVTPSANYNFQLGYVKKNYDFLKGLGHNLQMSVDFGIWSVIAVPILRGLQFFYSLLNNYGLSIIVLTIIIRFLTFPLQYKSFKSMKKMQVIQPEIQKIREKFKDNPQKLQQETMALFKKSGANPVSGCLPMILQMPIFFAFYKVLYTSVELVDAPFYFWILDLSEKDPFYILPILMGISMFLNMKLTPTTTADPAQQKVMMFMPVLFTFFMVNLPSGLTLYILVSTIVGMLQQIFVFKRTTT